MGPACLFPDSALAVEWIRLGPGAVQIGLEPTAAFCRCPTCGIASYRVHSHYVRELLDLPAHGRVIHLQIRLRRFFCDFRDCPQQTFAEQVPEVMMRHSRKTCRLIAGLQHIALSAGAESGARLSNCLGMPTSPDTLLRLIRRLAPQPVVGPRVLGVDDWAFHRGRRYGTILCDLESHRPVDLLPERSASSLAAWLREHPGTQIISRDRGSEYARGAAQGAPLAKQVADRWHLLHNLIEAFERALDRNHALLAQVAKTLHHRNGQASSPLLQPVACSEVTERVEHPVLPAAPTQPSIEQSPEPLPAQPTRRQKLQEQRRSRRLARYERIKELQAQGVPLLRIARQLNLARCTVRRYARSEEFPERPARRSRCIVSRTSIHRSRSAGPLDAYMDYLKQRWDEGCRKAAQLYREVKERGFTGSPYMVRRRVAEWRDKKESANSVSAWRPSARTVAWLLLKPDHDRPIEQIVFLNSLIEAWPALMESVTLIQEFRSLLCRRRPNDLQAWVELANEPSILPEIKQFAQNLHQDWAAVLEAVEEPWSNGQVEGQVNRLKLIKRQMYGRANFDLLRQRVLHAI